MKKRRDHSVPRALAMMLALALPSCAAAGTVEADAVGRTESALSVGNLCASPANGGDFCVPATQGAAAAWDQAAAHGPQPIQMWATRPADVTLDALVGNLPKLNAWLADIDTVLTFVRETKKSAESYNATMAGKLGALLKEAQDRQNEILSEGAKNSPFDAFKQALTEKANVAKGPLVAELAASKQKMVAVRAVVDRAKTDIDGLRGNYNSLVEQFKTYRATEASSNVRLTALAQQASQSTLANMSTAEEQIIAFAREESLRPDAVLMGAARLSGTFRARSAQLAESLEPYGAFMREKGAAVPDMTSSAVGSLANMISYCETRRIRVDEAVARLIDGLAVRREALIALEADNATRGTIAQAHLLKASTTFLNDASQRIADLWRVPPMSTTLKLPFLAQRYDQFTTFLQMEPLCAGTDTSWRESGCVALRRHFTTARSYQTSTIPLLIRVGISQMRSRGVPAALLNEAQAKLTAGSVKAAAVAYDEAVRASEAR